MALMTPRRFLALLTVGAVVGWAGGTKVAFGAPPPVAAPTTAQEAFDAAQAHFQEGRQLQRLHRNTPAAIEAFGKALDGYEAAARQAEGTPLGARALYMTGSTLLFLDRPAEAIPRYAEVARRYPTDPYATKALLRKAYVEKDSLEPDAARRTVAALDVSAADAAELTRIQRSFEVIGHPAPELEARTWIGGKAVSLAALRGDVVLLYFFTTWCPNCEKEADFIRELAGRWSASGVRMIGVTDNSRGQTDEAVAAYAEKHKFDFPIMVDDASRTSTAYRGGSVPTMVVIDRAGIIRWHDHPAALSDAVLKTLTAETK